jgi:hypothetical protein
MKIKIYKDLKAEVLPTPGNSKHSTLFVFQTLTAGDVKIAHETQIYNFVELLSAFISNQLQVNKEYKLIYRDLKESQGGYAAKVVSKDEVHYLRVIIGKKEYYFEKYECRIITRILNKILSKCTFSELTGYER